MNARMSAWGGAVLVFFIVLSAVFQPFAGTHDAQQDISTATLIDHETTFDDGGNVPAATGPRSIFSYVNAAADGIQFCSGPGHTTAETMPYGNVTIYEGGETPFDWAKLPEEYLGYVPGDANGIGSDAMYYVCIDAGSRMVDWWDDDVTYYYLVIDVNPAMYGGHHPTATKNYTAYSRSLWGEDSYLWVTLVPLPTLTAFFIGPDTVLEWSDMPQVNNTLTGYDMYRAPRGSSSWVRIASNIPQGTETYTDVGHDYFSYKWAISPVFQNGFRIKGRSNFVVDWYYPPVANAGPDQTVSEDTLVTFDGSGSIDGSEPITNYTWEFTDGTEQTLFGVSPNYTFSTPGIYVVWLTVMDDPGCPATDVMTVTVLDNTPPSADAGEDITVDEDTAMTFNATGSLDNLGITNYTWSFLDGVNRTLFGPSPSYVFHTPGIYDVNLTVEDGSGMTDTDEVVVTALDITAPVANAGADQTIDEDAPMAFNASGSSDNVGIASFAWEFMDGVLRQLTGPTPVYTFATPGIFVVALTAEDSAGNKGNDTVTITVADITPPEADAGPDRFVNEDQTVMFDGTNSTDNAGVATFRWNFTDGTEQELLGASPTYVFSTPGIYIVSLTVTDDAGLSDADVAVITVADATAPVADAGADQLVDEDTPATLDGTDSWDNVGITSYSWSFLDGIVRTLAGARPVYVFATPGTYLVTLTVEDAMGFTANDTLVIFVADVTPPTADAGTDLSADEDAPVTFNGLGSGDNVGIANYTWSFDDGANRTLFGATPSYAFEMPGTYLVTLTVADAAGNAASDTVSVTVADITPPVADAGVDQSVDEDTPITFDGTASVDNVGIVSFDWSFADGEPRHLAGVQPGYLFSSPGEYIVTLSVADAAGHTDADTVTISVRDVTPPVANAGPDLTVVNGRTAYFDGTATADNVGVVNFTWTFVYGGEPRTLYGGTPSFIFLVNGTYTVTLVARDAAGNSAQDTMVATVVTAMFSIPLSPGWNLISFPTEEDSWALADVLAPISGCYDSVQAYDARRGVWLLFSIGAPPYVNTLGSFNGEHGFWIHIVSHASVQLPLFGQFRAGTATIFLHAGWNLVGCLPGAAGHTINQALLAMPWDLVQKCDQSRAYNLRTLPGTYVMVRGEGYWIHVTEDCEWVAG